MSNPPQPTSRLAALRSMTTAQRAACIAAQPAVAAMISKPIALQQRRYGATLFDVPAGAATRAHDTSMPPGVPKPPKSPKPPKMPKIDVESLALMFDSVLALTANLAGASDHQARLLTVAHYFGGSATRAQLDAEPHGLTAARLDALIESVVVRLLAVRSGDGIRLLPGVSERLALPLPSLAVAVVNDVLTSDQLAMMLLAADLDAPQRKAERAAAVVRLCADVECLRRILLSLSPNALAMVSQLVEAGTTLRPGDLGVDPWRASYMRATGDKDFEAYLTLRHRALVSEDPSGGVAAWMELSYASTNSVFPPWPRPVELSAQPIVDTAIAQPTIASTIGSLLRAVAAEPLAALKTGGIGVSVTRALAKRLSIPAPRVTVLLGLLRVAHVVVPRSELVGTGRRAEYITHYHVSDVLAEALQSLDDVGCWAAIVEQWLDGADQVGAVWHAEFDARIGRREIVGDLLRAESGTGFDADRFLLWQSFRHRACGSRTFETVVDELRSLELVPQAGPVGLTPLARILLVDPSAAAAALPAVASTFIVQPDHTVVADARLDVAIRVELERLTTPVSTGGALVYRLDPVKIAGELSNGATGEMISDFLERHASVALPMAIRTMVADAERQRGGLTINGAATVLTADDPVVLARAVAVKAAKLRLIGPTVAVSDLRPSVVTNALRAKGLAPSNAETSPSRAGSATIDGAIGAAPAEADLSPRPVVRPVTVVHPDLATITRRLQETRG